MRMQADMGATRVQAKLDDWVSKSQKLGQKTGTDLPSRLSWEAKPVKTLILDSELSNLEVPAASTTQSLRHCVTTALAG